MKIIIGFIIAISEFIKYLFDILIGVVKITYSTNKKNNEFLNLIREFRISILFFGLIALGMIVAKYSIFYLLIGAIPFTIMLFVVADYFWIKTENAFGMGIFAYLLVGTFILVQYMSTPYSWKIVGTTVLTEKILNDGYPKTKIIIKDKSYRLDELKCKEPGETNIYERSTINKYINYDNAFSYFLECSGKVQITPEIKLI